MRTLAELLRDWREQRGFTQKEAGQMIGLSESGWSLLESGKRQPRRSTLLALSQATGIALNVLYQASAYALSQQAERAEAQPV